MNKCTTDGKPPIDPNNIAAPGPINPSTGQHTQYWVLCKEERDKGFIRPYRDIYKHVGINPKYPLRDLTDEEEERYAEYGYVKYEEYPKSESSVVGRFWTQSDLNNLGCGVLTSMSNDLAETYARDPKFYGKTFCICCGGHFPVEEFEWLDGEIVGS
jgi:hypothetical protein